MKDERIEAKIETLTEAKREQFHETLEEREEELRKELLEQHRDRVENQILEDKEELNNFNVIVSGFQKRDGTDYTYIRTEPLIHEGKKNFDLLIGSRSKGIAVLVEYERTLASGTDESVGKFVERKSFVKSGGDEDIDVEEYLKEVMSSNIAHLDFVLSSQHTPNDRLTAAGERKDVSFCVWDLGDHGVSCSIYYFPVKSEETAPFKGHTDDELESYIIEELSNRVPKHDYLDFTFSSSNYLKLKHMAMVLMKRHHGKGRETFDFEDWEQLFAQDDIELNNYLQEEKERLYRNFITYGQSCGVVVLEEDKGYVLKNRYRIKTAAKTDAEKIDEEVEQKIAEHEMSDDFDSKLKDLKLDILDNLHSTDKTTLSDFHEE